MQTEHALPCLSAFQAHHHDLLRFFTRKLGCRDLAADCTQDTYVHLVRMGQTITVQNPRALLFRVAANLSIDYLRKARTRRSVLSGEPLQEETASPSPTAEDALDAKQRLILLEAAMQELSVKCKRALLLNRLDGKTHKEIAQVLGVSESMVAKYIIQALKHCRSKLQDLP
jgi:RNA polymerase sigma-70 factor (ECF subfamily)